MTNPSLDGIFSALSDPTRRAQLKRLSEGAASISELAAPFDMSLPAASKHIRILERAGLISCEKVGRTHMCRIKPATIRLLDEWLTFYRPFWEDRLADLEAFATGSDRKNDG